MLYIGLEGAPSCYLYLCLDPSTRVIHDMFLVLQRFPEVAVRFLR